MEWHDVEDHSPVNDTFASDDAWSNSDPAPQDQLNDIHEATPTDNGDSGGTPSETVETVESSLQFEATFFSPGTDVGNAFLISVLGGELRTAPAECSAKLSPSDVESLRGAAERIPWMTTLKDWPCSSEQSHHVEVVLRYQTESMAWQQHEFAYCEERTVIMPTRLVELLSLFQTLGEKYCGTAFQRVYRSPDDVYLSERESFRLSLLATEAPCFLTYGSVLMEIRDGYFLMPGYRIQPMELRPYDWGVLRELALGLGDSTDRSRIPEGCMFGVPKFELGFESFSEAGVQTFGDLQFCLVEPYERLESNMPALRDLLMQLYVRALQASGRRLTVPPLWSQSLSATDDTDFVSTSAVDVSVHWANGFVDRHFSEGLFGDAYWYSDDCAAVAIDPALVQTVADAAYVALEYIESAAPLVCNPDTPTITVAIRLGEKLVTRVFCESSGITSDRAVIQSLRDSLAAIRSGYCGY